jgi:hypothetical protein
MLPMSVPARYRLGDRRLACARRVDVGRNSSADRNVNLFDVFAMPLRPEEGHKSDNSILF